MNKRIAKKKAKALMKQEKPFISAKEVKALSKQRVLESLRAPRRYEGSLETGADYWAAIKKYHDYVNKGLIKESSVLDKYEAADAFYSTLSKSEEMDVKQQAIQKAEKLIAESLQRKANLENPDYIRNKYGF